VQTTETRELLAAAIEHQPMAVFVVRFDGADPLNPPIVYINEAFCRLTGYSRGEVAEGTYPRIVGPLTDLGLIASQARRVADGEHVVVPEVALYHRSGKAFWARVHAHPLEGSVPHGVLVLEDISESREREKQLALLSEAVEQASDFVIVTDTRSHEQGGPRFVYVNRALFEATGYTVDEIIGQPYTLIYSPNNDSAFMKSVRDAIEAGEPNYREMLAVRKDGSEFWIEFVAKPFAAGNQTYRLSIGRDITLRKRAFNQIALLFSALEQSPHRVILYERDASGELAPSYENEPAAALGSYRLQKIWQSESDAARTFRQNLLAGESVEQVYAEEIEGVPALTELVASGIRNGNQLAAVMTTERALINATTAEMRKPSLAAFAALLPALTQAASPPERFAALRAILRSSFDADVTEIGTTIAGGVRVSPGSNSAYFGLGGRFYSARWAAALEPAALTALRFCIEAAIDPA
jgi:PAS domain S-box-containing protein